MLVLHAELRRFIMKRAFLFFAATIPVSAHAAGDAQAGNAVFASRCASCHSVGPSARAGFGPQLNGIFGRKAGGTSDYAYSPAMKNARIVWTDETLRQFLTSPGDVVPGTKMRIWGIRGKEIDDLLAYLHTFK